MSDTQPTLPVTTVTLYLQVDGTYTEASTGVAGEQPVQVPVNDALCIDDLDPNGNETSSDLQALAQDVYHILLETLGSNLDDPTRGVGIEGALSGSTVKLAALARNCDAQLRKDDRVDSSTTTIILQSDGSYLFKVDITAAGALLPLTYSYTQESGLVPS
jgi:hypothetical protein